MRSCAGGPINGSPAPVRCSYSLLERAPISDPFRTDPEKELTMPLNENSVWFITGCSTGFGRELAQ